MNPHDNQQPSLPMPTPYAQGGQPVPLQPFPPQATPQGAPEQGFVPLQPAAPLTPPGFPQPMPAAPVAGQPFAAPLQPFDSPVSATAPVAAYPAAPPVPQSPLQPAPASQLPQLPATTPEASPDIAADNDMIEKSWIDKAKEIITTTRDDPYQQSRQLAALKADYLQKRYNKSIKLSE